LLKKITIDYKFSVFFLSWLGFYYNGIFDRVILQESGIPMWSIFLFISLFLALFFSKKNRSKKINILELLCICLFFFMISPAFITADMYSLSILSLLISPIISSNIGDFNEPSLKQKQFICNFAWLTSISALVLFFYFSYFNRPIFGIDQIRPGYGYAIDRGILLRLVGMADDPNFYALASLLPFLLALYTKEIKYRKVILFSILLSVVFTFSRTGIVIYVLAFSLSLLNKNKGKIHIIMILSITTILCIMSWKMIYFLTIDFSHVVNRSFDTGIMSRFALLESVYGRADENLKIFGNGVGISKDLIGLHSHNTYFDYLFEGGIVAFMIFMIFSFLSTFNSFVKKGYLHGFNICIFVSAFTLSLSFNPILILLPLLIYRHNYKRRKI
jgi:O-antigen ligase